MASPAGPATVVVPAPPDARPGGLRVLAALAVAGLWVVAVHFGVPGRWGGWALNAVLVVLCAAAFTAAGLAAKGPWRRPVRLVGAGEGRLRVPAGPGFSWYLTGQILFLTALVGPGQDDDLLRAPDVSAGPVRYALTALLLALAALVIGGLVAAVFDGRPRIDLTPAGIEIRGVLGRRNVPWAAVAPGTPQRSWSGNTLVLTVVRPELVERRGTAWSPASAPWLDLRWLPIHPWFLSDVLRWYVDHPQERVAVGTPAGNERLCRALGVA
ncbi:PH domain-containing protein [Micromonospora sp. NPDC007271]|uniref:PH domain-containing protein n=1 Tax=Micromonospora sp. NPDC007271 TaxID=3154587 RepID=UPI0033CB8DF9